jgi:UDP-N-acetylmuramoyl-L-alanyl-D-glutamate--2,6-diaminopimelate ligase
MLKKIKNLVSDQNPLRLLYHKVLAVVAAIWYRFPAKRMHVIAVTGTKGKTTTVNLIAGILAESGQKVGMISTIMFRIGEKSWANISKQTTLSPFAMQKLLRRMLDEQCKYVVLEVSSHAISQSRIWGIPVDTALITNMGQDHLEYHGSFEAYLKAKGELFKSLNASFRKPHIPKVAILNKDDAYFDYFDQFAADRKFFYGLNEGIVRAINLNFKPEGTQLDLIIPNGQVHVNLSLPGEGNVYNALAAVCACLSGDLTADMIKAALERANQIPGRFEHVECGQKYSVIVDYAHTTESLEQLLALYKGICKGRLILVFGATGGGRDKAKRPEMGRMADKYADLIVVTNDDPYEESQIEIVDQISDGINRKEGEKFWQILDRRQAIRLALLQAREGDIVVIAGKGCEEVQAIGGVMIPWDDRQVVREILQGEVIVEI